jgi:hypothetical protein
MLAARVLVLPGGAAHGSGTPGGASPVQGDMRVPIAIATLLLTLSCTGQATDQRPATPSSSLSDSPPPTFGSLLVEAKLECCFVEGGYFFVRILDQAGESVLRRTFPVDETTVRLQRALLPGSYELVTFAGGCPPNGCSTPRDARPEADAPLGACRTAFTIRSQELVKAFVDDPISGGCAVTLE